MLAPPLVFGPRAMQFLRPPQLHARLGRRTVPRTRRRTEHQTVLGRPSNTSVNISPGLILAARHQSSKRAHQDSHHPRRPSHLTRSAPASPHFCLRSTAARSGARATNQQSRPRPGGGWWRSEAKRINGAVCSAAMPSEAIATLVGSVAENRLSRAGARTASACRSSAGQALPRK
jgi:hypothetical protein